MYDIIVENNKIRGNALLKQLEGKTPFFGCVIGVSETAKIAGLSAAGENPELTDYTPPADVELLQLGHCRCIPGLPMTPDGIPTPALITMSALKLANIPCLVASAGLKIKPYVPFLDLGGKPGRDIRTGNALENAEEVMIRAKIAGENVSQTIDYMVIGESIPGGTTTALGTLLAMGIDAKGKVSSSMPNNPHKLKIRIVEEGLKASGIKFGDYADDPIKAVSALGDPMIPAHAGMVLGAAENVPVIMAGGTQMAATLAVIEALDSTVLDDVAIGTTKWVITDKTADLKGLVAEIADIPIFAADLNFAESKFEGLKAYETGVVKDGVGAGGAAIAAMLKSKGKITKEVLLKEIEKNYKQLVNSK